MAKHRPNTAPAPAAEAVPHSSATESPVQPTEDSATQPAEMTPPAGEPHPTEAAGSSHTDEAANLPLAGAAEYTVLSPLDHDGQRYEVGGRVVLMDEAAARLPAGVVQREEA